MKQIEKYNIFEKSICGLKPTNSDVKVDFTGTFSKGNRKIKVKGFYNGDNEYLVRFMPDEEGIWHYELNLNISDEINEIGNFECIRETGNNHGQVIVNGMNFMYADGSKYIPIGTTMYAWIHQPNHLIQKTIDTLSKSPFNKVRMCLFPKSYMYNNNDPDVFPFEKKEDGKWDVNKPNFEFWKHLEQQLKALLDLGIEADLILFHPYDKWGFSEFDRDDDLTYLDYCIRRLSAFRNIWWSLANEYELLSKKNDEDWEIIGEFIYGEDPYHHLLSIHNFLKMYDASKPWITHCSIQTRQCEVTKLQRDQYKKPVIIDECRYEGDIETNWGNISGYEMVHRFWSSMLLGGYCTHGETYHNEEEILWWSKGGELHGESVRRIAFLKDIMYELDGEIKPDPLWLNPNLDGINEKLEEESEWNKLVKKIVLGANPVEKYLFTTAMLNYSCRNEDKYFIRYFGDECCRFYDILLPEDAGEYTVEVIDVWEMTRNIVAERAKGKTRISLSAKVGIAVLATKN